MRFLTICRSKCLISSICRSIRLFHAFLVRESLFFFFNFSYHWLKQVLKQTTCENFKYFFFIFPFFRFEAICGCQCGYNVSVYGQMTLLWKGINNLDNNSLTIKCLTFTGIRRSYNDSIKAAVIKWKAYAKGISNEAFIHTVGEKSFWLRLLPQESKKKKINF